MGVGLEGLEQLAETENCCERKGEEVLEGTNESAKEIYT
jgi:hypothetical protein